MIHLGTTCWVDKGDIWVNTDLFEQFSTLAVYSVNVTGGHGKDEKAVFFEVVVDFADHGWVDEVLFVHGITEGDKLVLLKAGFVDGVGGHEECCYALV
jgi:hypothetical protein